MNVRGDVGVVGVRIVVVGEDSGLSIPASCFAIELGVRGCGKKSVEDRWFWMIYVAKGWRGGRASLDGGFGAGRDGMNRVSILRRQVDASRSGVKSARRLISIVATSLRNLIKDHISHACVGAEGGKIDTQTQGEE